MTTNEFITILLAVLGSSALFEFLRFMISRKDEKSKSMDSCYNALMELRKDVASVHSDIDKLEAMNSRIRILQASDEMRRKLKHSEEYFIQLNDDITLYNKYCADHPDFRNNRAVHAVENINRVYSELLKTNDFL